MTGVPTKVTLVFHLEVELSADPLWTGPTGSPADELNTLSDEAIIECWAEDPFHDLGLARVQVRREFDDRTVEGPVYQFDGPIGGGKIVQVTG